MLEMCKYANTRNFIATLKRGAYRLLLAYLHIEERCIEMMHHIFRSEVIKPSMHR